MLCHGRPRPECLGLNVVPWEAETSVFRHKILCHGRPRPVCLG